MQRKSGRPIKSDEPVCSRQYIIDTAAAMIKEKGADSVTVRSVCETANIGTGTFYHYFKNKDALMICFLPYFDGVELKTPYEDISGRICELYMLLINCYKNLGIDFMKKFYTTSNKALSAYMGEENESFPKGSVMQRSEVELNEAKRLGYIPENANVHQYCKDICTIVKGCIFEWCLTEKIDIEKTLRRLISNYMIDCKR